VTRQLFQSLVCQVLDRGFLYLYLRLPPPLGMRSGRQGRVEGIIRLGLLAIPYVDHLAPGPLQAARFTDVSKLAEKTRMPK
jgi:hypothetical protein